MSRMGFMCENRLPRRRAATAFLILVAWCFSVPCRAAVDGRGRAMRVLESGRIDEAVGVFDSLAVSAPSNGVPAYWAARALEMSAREEQARCRYLSIEREFAGKDAAKLSAARRITLERRRADALITLGSSAAEGQARPGDTILLLPPDNIGPPQEGGNLGLAWTFLMAEALRGSRLCPVSQPEMLTVLDLLGSGRPVRATAEVVQSPVNTVPGLRARLALLPGPDGRPYLEGDEDWGDALLRFQSDQGLPATGEADVQTQGRLDQAMETWLRQAPPPLDPVLVPRAAQLVHAASVLRGTYRIQLGRVLMELTLLDPSGAPVFQEPISLVFPLEETARRAAEAAGLVLGGEQDQAGRASTTLSLAELEAAAASALPLERGLPTMTERRWQTSPGVWFDWPWLAEIREAARARPPELAWEEREMTRAWLERPHLDAAAALRSFCRETELGGAGPSFDSILPPEALAPGPYSLTGGEGLLRIRVEGP